MNYFDCKTEQPKERITARRISVVVLLFMLIMLPFGGMVYKQCADKAAKVEAARLADLQKKTIAAMMVNLPQKPIEAFVIAKGKTGQAKMISTFCGEPDNPASPTLYGSGTIANHPTYLQVSQDCKFVVNGKEIVVGTDTNPAPDGWIVSPEGVITVSANATIGKYRAGYIARGGCSNEKIPGALQKEFVFEVINSTVSQAANNSE